MALSTEIDLTIAPQLRLPEDGVLNQLNAALLSGNEQAWLLKHLDESPAKALKNWDKAIPHNPEEQHKVVSVNPWCEEHPGVSPKDMEIILRRIRDVEESTPERFGYYKRLPQIAPLIAAEPNKEYWGLEAIRAVIRDFQTYTKRFQEITDKTPSVARHPTLYTTDARGHMTWGGVGSDRGIIRAFVAWILHQEVVAVDSVWAAAAANDNIPMSENIEEAKLEGKGADFRLIEGPNFYECCVKGCNKRFDFPEDDQGEKRKAWNKMRMHMVHVKKSQDDHREARLVIFG